MKCGERGGVKKIKRIGSRMLGEIMRGRKDW